jgi:rod shape-determining protein MreC
VSGAGLVGRVRETGPHGAIVQTLADPQSRANVFLSGSGLQGTVIGGPGALQVQIQHHAGAAPTKGEWAMTSGIGGGYPRGLVVGEVVNVTHSDAATVDAALVDWVNNPATLTLVIVVTDFTPS